MRSRRAELTLMVAVFVAHAYIYNGGGWNQDARLGAIFAFVEPGTAHTHTFQINDFLNNRARGVVTGDWARVGDAYYPAKGPGASMLGVPLYFCLYHVERALGVEPTTQRATLVNAYVLNLWLSVLWGSIGTAFLYRFLRRHRGYEHGDALFVCAVFAFGSLVFPYATQVWGHGTTAVCLLLAFGLSLERRRNTDLAVGLFAGLAVSVEYLAALGAAAVALSCVSRTDWRARLPRIAAGAALPALALLAYQKACFGGFFVSSYAFVNPIFFDQRSEVGLFGRFDPTVIWSLLASRDRGLLLFTPVFCFAAIEVVRLAKARDTRYLLTCLAAVVVPLVALSSYAFWNAGNSTGARYLTFTVPFWCLLLPRPSTLARPARWFAYGAAAVSALNMLVIAAVNPMVPRA